ncbi:MAG: hypothetical protein IH863_05885 [Chloroflexi bacterium]|nr:hypothetical protein [Chloroflexota bacterium]
MSPEATPPEEETPKEAIKRYRENFATEIDGIAVYRMLAELEEVPARRKIFEELAEVEEHHAEVWRQKLRDAGVPWGGCRRLRALSRRPDRARRRGTSPSR